MLTLSYVHQKPVCYYRQANTLSFEIFKLIKKEPGRFSLHLNYSENELNIGIPTRNNHKIAAIKQQQVIQYRINGKSDFTLTGRKARTFIELDYLVEYKGQADTITFTETISPFNSLSKSIFYKLIDERKRLN